MSIISSAASSKDGIVFYGSQYKVVMKEKEDGAIEYKYSEIKKPVQTVNKKMRRIFLIRGLHEFFKIKLAAVTWLIGVIVLITMRNMQIFDEKIYSNAENMVMILSNLITIGLLFRTLLLLFRRMGDFKKTWAYHGAEHKVIHALNNDLELTLENVRAQKRYDPYCGSMLVFWVLLLMIVSLLISPYAMFFFPITFAISWEIFFLKNGENLPGLRWMYNLGYLVQEKVITKEPTDEMILASIDAVKLLVELETKQ